jgi:hypothetical protein
MISLFAGQALSEEWLGHLARLDYAKAACRDLSSQACEPYLAEAVGIVDYIRWEEAGGDREYCDKLNGQDVTRFALIMDEKLFFYWSQAVIAATRSICKLP